MKLNKNLSKLNFKVINITSTEENNIINNKERLSKLLQPGGYQWISERFCSYPQEIIIQFESPVYLSQINLLCDEKKISKHLIFDSFCPDEFDDKKYKYSDINFKYIGFVDLKDNRDCNYQVRELKKVFINIKTLFLKIILDNNYINNYNKFQQVGIINIECLGNTINNELNIDFQLKDHNKELQNQLNINVENLIREIIGDKYNTLLEKIANIDKKNNNDEYMIIKNKIEEMNNIGKKIYQIKLLEKNASNNDNFDKAMELKNKREKNKNKLYEIINEIYKIFEIDINNKLDEKLENESEIKEINNNNDNQDFTLKNNNFENENKQKKKKILISLTELDLLKDTNDHDDIVVPTVNKKKLIKNKSEIELKNEEENKYKQKLKPLEKLTEENLKDFKLLINYLKEDGLRYLLSNQFGYKVKGYKILSNKLNDIFVDDKINEIIYELINLESLFLEDKNNSSLIQSFQIIKKTFYHIIDNETEIKKDKKLLNYIKDRIMNKIISYLGDGESKIREGASQLYLNILKKNLFNFNTLVNNLLSNDINDSNYSLSNNTQNIKIFSKLNIIKNILEDYENIINNNYTTEDSFPKDIILDYICLNIKNNKLEIKTITRELLELAAQIFGPESLKQKIYFHIDDEKELIKLISQISSLKPLLNNIKKTNNINIANNTINTNNKKLSKSNSQNNIFNSRPKNIKLKKNASQLNIKSNSKYGIKNQESKYTNKNKGKCEFCKKNLGNIVFTEHKKKCLMYGKCDECGEYILVEKLNYHKLNVCKNKKKYKGCKKCKEAIRFDLYDLHINKNKCNIARDDMNRCPLCHHDIEKSNEGFYQHLVVDGCAYQKK